MGQIEEVIILTRKIESLLDGVGATGKGIHEKINSVEGKYSSYLVKKIHGIASIRNKTMHVDGFMIEDFDEFKATCNEVISELSLNRKQRTSSTSQKYNRYNSYKRPVSQNYNKYNSYKGPTTPLVSSLGMVYFLTVIPAFITLWMFDQWNLFLSFGGAIIWPVVWYFSSEVSFYFTSLLGAMMLYLELSQNSS
ncbi:hypothetical protein [Sedimenticola hydrogenitrophicus]|uniref:hypothetical protein n=1 Tax=Sedimenticola hydrogenitrophicus TaxID=2967975 RepID=UPI0021A2E93D|nr:hypothetical protein [Sedimenticola hydrogenitrophicus]